MKEAYEAIKTTVLGLYQKIGFQYRACFLYGSLPQGFYQHGQSDVNLLVVVEDGTSIHDVREALLPVWGQYGDILQRVPGVATKSAFERHMQLFPLLARHIDQYGKQVRGSRRTLGRTASLDASQEVARLAAQGMTAALNLAPQILIRPQDGEQAARLLSQLVRQQRRGDIGRGEQPAQLFHEFHTHLTTRLREAGHTWQGDPPADPPYPVPGLVAVYEKLDYLLLVVDDIAPLRGYDWATLAQSFAGRYGGMQVMTAAQLRLAVQWELTLELTLRNYNHQWGHDLLADVHPSPELVMRDAARFASQIAIFDMPHAYVTADPSQYGKLIHDFQNKLLNARLQNELLARMGFVQSQQPPTPLPDRTAPSLDRISAIFDHLDWWAHYYATHMQEQLMAGQLVR
jgi:hypothetical protein